MKNIMKQHKAFGLVVAFGGVALVGATADAEILTPFGGGDFGEEMWGLDGPKLAEPEVSEPNKKGGKIGHTDQRPVGRTNESDNGFFRDAMMAGPGSDGTGGAGGVPSDPFGTGVDDTSILGMLLDAAFDGAGDLGGSAPIEFDAFDGVLPGGLFESGRAGAVAGRGSVPTPGSAVLLVMGGAAAFGRRRRI